MKHTTNTQPLYKVLNEQRTQGEWYCEENSFEAKRTAAQTILECKSVDMAVDNTQRATNAKYTALAVNNLHHLAEALEELYNVTQHSKEAIAFSTELIKAKEALARIS